jgi:hypothetical protein
MTKVHVLFRRRITNFTMKNDKVNEKIILETCTTFHQIKVAILALSWTGLFG